MKRILFLLILLTSIISAYSGSGTQADPYVITTATGLDSIRVNRTAYYVLGKDIDMSTISNYVPIGTSSASAFTGTLDGRNHTISNLKINKTQTIYVGFIGYSKGYIKRVKFYNCSVTATFTDDGFYNNVIAGIVVGFAQGNIAGYTLFDSVVVHKCTVKASGYYGVYAGGIAGQVSSGTNLTRCSVSYSDILADKNKSASITAYVGGIVGSLNGALSLSFSDSIRIKVSTIYTTSRFSNPYVGGLIGYQDGYSITDCYSKLSYIYGGAGYAYLGTLAGFRQATCTAEINNWSSSRVDFYQAVAGDTTKYRTGWRKDISITTTNCYFDSILARTGRAAVTSTITPLPYGKTSSQMKNQLTYTGFNFSTTWQMDIMYDGYPYLKNNLPIFALKPTIVVTNPVGNEILSPGDVLNIRYTSILIDTLFISYTTDSSSYTSIGSTIDKEQYNWVLPDIKSETVQIKVMTRTGTVGDTSNVFTIASDIIKFTSVTIAKDSVHISLTSKGIDSLKLYYKSPSDSTWRYLRKINLSGNTSLTTNNYSFILGEFFKGKLQLKVDEDRDTTIYAIPQITISSAVSLLPNYQSCWYLSENDTRYGTGWIGGTPIEFHAIQDLGCGWVSSATFGYYNIRANSDFDGIIESHVGYTNAQRITSVPEPNPVLQPVVVRDTVEHTDYNVSVSQLYEFGNVVTLNSRRYYIEDKKLYCDDIINNVSKLLIKDLSSYYNVPANTYGIYLHMINPKLLAIYTPPSQFIGDTVYNMPLTNQDTYINQSYRPKLVIFEPSGIPAYWSMEALNKPNISSPLLSATWESAESVIPRRNYFRGIYPRILR